ncbi:MAG: DNA repair protein RadC [Thiomicrorhabdus sp.]|nr:DNA repair protein RadC [Thiomicrorhabdus sp.]
MSITDWHEHDRPREKLLKFGAQHLSDAELLAIFLRVGVKGSSAVDLAQILLEHFGSLHALLNANQEDFCQIKGLGQAKYVQFKALLELSHRHFKSELSKGPAFNDPEKVAHYLAHSLAFKNRESFMVLLLDQQHQLIHSETLFTGTINQSQVHVREILKFALEHHAAAVILAHNHPSGDPTPSQSDIELTKTLTHALQLIEIRTLDHIIIGNNGRWHSLAQHQQMPI